ncbi:Y-family DNA polymerase [Parvularcula maris]|uniref:DNA-directed DNA polymerase n=1 Tax=Parvularcula maris TaxID=2965077 RepID=A0A9X2RGZ2_9PROT|nr:hypothetical protein [Parvularcula maris]MCQ8184395.1 hypothetical protein [Parvularcula maris]
MVFRDGVPGYYDRLGYLFLDFNAFFASVEQADNPSLCGRPVMVTPLESDHTGAIAASYEARPYGIKRGTTVREARRLCPDIVIIAARHDRYVAIHQDIKETIEEVLPIHTVYSVDEVACSLSPSEGEPEAALRTARAVKAALHQRFGPALRSSIGLAQTRLLGKLAAESRKPDGLTVFLPTDLPQRLSGMALHDIPGIGNGMLARLENVEVRTCEQLWTLSPKQMRKIWNSVEGERFWYALHGYETDEPRSKPKKSMIGHSRVLGKDHETPEGARIVARALVLKAAARLRHYGYRTRNVSLYSQLRKREGQLEAMEGSTSLEATADSFAILEAFDHLWTHHLEEIRRRTGVQSLRFGKVAIYLSHLTALGSVEERQTELFAGAGDLATTRNRERLWKMIDALNADEDGKIAGLGKGKERGPAIGRYVTLAAQLNLDLNYLGGKIAFSRVPDQAEFVM